MVSKRGMEMIENIETAPQMQAGTGLAQRGAG
jgi:hypothetical protein